MAWHAGRLADWQEYVDEIPPEDFELFFELWERGRFDERRADLRARQVLRCLYALHAQEFTDRAFEGYLDDAAEETELEEHGPTIEGSRDNVREMLRRASAG